MPDRVHRMPTMCRMVRPDLTNASDPVPSKDDGRKTRLQSADARMGIRRAQMVSNDPNSLNKNALSDQRPAIDIVGVAGSIPAAPTIFSLEIKDFSGNGPDGCPALLTSFAPSRPCRVGTGWA